MLRILWINPVGIDMYDEHIRKIIEGIKRPDVEATVGLGGQRKKVTTVSSLAVFTIQD